MENASKALIIAGAILLAILLISLGIMIFNQAQDTISNSGMSQAEKTAFNQKFTKYEGNQKGSVVRSLLQEVQASNSDDNNKDAKRTIIVYYQGAGASGALSDEVEMNSSSGIKNTTTYTIAVFYGTNGCVDQIKIAEGENVTLKKKTK